MVETHPPPVSSTHQRVYEYPGLHVIDGSTIPATWARTRP
jgi:hypothetical protein